jgi:hypothetical protein
MEDESMSRDAAKIIMEIVIRNAAEQDAVLTENSAVVYRR